MCGIFGMVSLRREALRFPEVLTAMGETLRHRGPDSHGLVRLRDAGIGCRRLRIVDLGAQADQPFEDPDSPCCLACNGEIYNAAELRQRYRDYRFRSRSDVEVILPLYRDRGAGGLAELDGMFAVAIWDQAARALVLARDRAGEKPLFYTRIDGELWFASEVQALLLHPGISRELDEVAIAQYLALGYVPAPRTTFQAVRTIDAGTIVRFTPEGEDVLRYWEPGAIEVASDPGPGAVAHLRSLIEGAMRKQMVAEVPIGVFVSGGLDSSLLASIVARNEPPGRLYTFTARFSDRSYDESREAVDCATRLGTEHHEVVIDERSLAEALGVVTEMLAEPLADPAILPTYLLAREAREYVKVILSGEGADELFGGYPTYLGHRAVPYFLALPGVFRRGLRAGIERFPASRRKVTLDFLLRRFVDGAEQPWPQRHFAWFGTGAQGLLAAGNRSPKPARAAFVAGPGGATDAMLLDYCTYLPDNLLVKNDRATMLNSVEARAPYLDRDVTAFALTLPERYKVRGLTTKWLLKQAAGAWLPKRTIQLRKRGLSVPVASWLDHGLRPEVDRLLDRERLARQELFDPRRVDLMVEEHRAGRANHARPLWALVVLQYWLEHWVPERAG